MSPECENWWQVPPEVEEDVEDLVGGKGKLLRSIQNLGFFFKKGNRYNTLIIESSLENTEKEEFIKKARRSQTLYHVMGFCNSKGHNRKQELRVEEFGNVTLENAKTRKGYVKHRFEPGSSRGKHRSANKGKGLDAFLRSKSGSG
jgi:hypothetical protein